MSRKINYKNSLHYQDILKVINLKPKEYFEIEYKMFGAFRATLTAYLRNEPLPEGVRISSLRVCKRYVFIFKVNADE
jgi:hypothetical protein